MVIADPHRSHQYTFSNKRSTLSFYANLVEWALIKDLVPDYTSNGQIRHPRKWSKREIVDGIFYATATGCHRRALPGCYPPWSTVYGYHLEWSRDGTWEKIVDRLREMLRITEGRDPQPSGGAINARSVRGASTVGACARGFEGIPVWVGAIVNIAVARPGDTRLWSHHTGIPGFDTAKKISGRKVFGLTDTVGLLVAVVAFAANVL